MFDGNPLFWVSGLDTDGGSRLLWLGESVLPVKGFLKVLWTWSIDGRFIVHSFDYRVTEYDGKSNTIFDDK